MGMSLFIFFCGTKQIYLSLLSQPIPKAVLLSSAVHINNYRKVHSPFTALLSTSATIFYKNQDQRACFFFPDGLSSRLIRAVNLHHYLIFYKLYLVA